MATETLTLHAMYDVIVQTAKNTSTQTGAVVYLATHQPERGEHSTALDSSQARTLARHLLAISADVDGEFERSLPDPKKATASIHSAVRP